MVYGFLWTIILVIFEGNIWTFFGTDFNNTHAQHISVKKIQLYYIYSQFVPRSDNMTLGQVYDLAAADLMTSCTIGEKIDILCRRVEIGTFLSFIVGAQIRNNLETYDLFRLYK